MISKQLTERLQEDLEKLANAMPEKFEFGKYRGQSDMIYHFSLNAGHQVILIDTYQLHPVLPDCESEYSNALYRIIKVAFGEEMGVERSNEWSFESYFYKNVLDERPYNIACFGNLSIESLSAEVESVCLRIEKYFEEMKTIKISGDRRVFKATVETPSGWRRLESAERVSKRDVYLRVDCNRPYWETILPRIGSYVGYQVCNIGVLVIRKIQKKASAK
jgi:hypothetical protein